MYVYCAKSCIININVYLTKNSDVENKPILEAIPVADTMYMYSPKSKHLARKQSLRATVNFLVAKDTIVMYSLSNEEPSRFKISTTHLSLSCELKHTIELLL